MGRGQRREALNALSRIAPDVAPTHRHDLEEVAGYLGTSVRELMRANEGYTTVQARERLGVSLPTVHAWITDGLLPLLPALKGAETLIDRGFVDKFAEALDAVRATGTPKHLLRDVAALLESKEFAEQNPEIARRLQKGAAGSCRSPSRRAASRPTSAMAK